MAVVYDSAAGFPVRNELHSLVHFYRRLVEEALTHHPRSCMKWRLPAHVMVTHLVKPSPVPSPALLMDEHVETLSVTLTFLYRHVMPCCSACYPPSLEPNAKSIHRHLQSFSNVHWSRIVSKVEYRLDVCVCVCVCVCRRGAWTSYSSIRTRRCYCQRRVS